MSEKTQIAVFVNPKEGWYTLSHPDYRDKGVIRIHVTDPKSQNEAYKEACAIAWKWSEEWRSGVHTNKVNLNA